MSARAALAAHLRTTPDLWDVIDRNTDPTITTTTVMVWTESIAPAGGIHNESRRRYTVVALVMTPKQVGYEDELEDSLEELLESIDQWDYPLVWTGAEAVVYADRYHAWRVTTEVSMKHVILEEV